MIYILHADEPTFMPELKGQYTAVAMLVTRYGPTRKQMELGFRLTQHVDSEWWLSPYVAKLVAGTARSSSVGDVFHDSTANRWALVDHQGFRFFSPLPQVELDWLKQLNDGLLDIYPRLVLRYLQGDSRWNQFR